jgi:hypothetical protein
MEQRMGGMEGRSRRKRIGEECAAASSSLLSSSLLSSPLLSHNFTSVQYLHLDGLYFSTHSRSSMLPPFTTVAAVPRF